MLEGGLPPNKKKCFNKDLPDSIILYYINKSYKFFKNDFNNFLNVHIYNCPLVVEHHHFHNLPQRCYNTGTLLETLVTSKTGLMSQSPTAT